jgi:hypothetical protein
VNLSLQLLRFSTIVLVIEYSLHPCTLAQVEPKPFSLDTSRIIQEQTNIAALGFDKNLSTYQWSGVVNLKTLLGPLSVDVDERYRSTIISTQRKLIRDEQIFNFGIKHPVSEHISLVARANNFVLSDDQRLIEGSRQSVTTASSNAVYGGVEVEIVPRLFAEPLVGARFDNQIGIRDKGVSYTLSTWTPGLEFDGYRTLFAGRFQQDRLEPRTLERRSLAMNVEKVFVAGTRDTLGIEYTSNQRDFYFSADTTTSATFNVSHNIERRVEELLAISNLLEYRVADRTVLTLYGNLSSRNIVRRYRYRPVTAASLLNTRIEEFRLGGTAQIKYVIADDVSTAVELHFNERDESHTVERDDRIPSDTDKRQLEEAKKDNVARRSMLAGLFDARISHSDTILFSGSASILRYDTPHPGNFEERDDRDELLYSLNLTTLHRINSYVHLRVTADVTLAHLVYLSGLRSGDNAWNRVFRLAPRVHYVPSKYFSTTNTFEVLANYTVYDFENTPFARFAQTSSAFRQFALIDSTRWNFTPRLAWEGFVHVRLYQRGELRWSEFKERPLNYFEDKTFIGRIEFAPEPRLILSVGIRYFSQMRFSYAEGTRVFESILKSIGPVGRVQWEVGERSQIIIDGWRERQTQDNAPSRSFTNLTLAVNVRL